VASDFIWDIACASFASRSVSNVFSSNGGDDVASDVLSDDDDDGVADNIDMA